MKAGYLRATARYIRRVQEPSGAIPWFPGGILDPWDHVEAAMGLSTSGHLAEAEAAYRWLARHQRGDGCWLAAYRSDAVVDGSRAESNFVAYVATGVWHHYLISRDRRFLDDLWPTVVAAMEFVLRLQASSGEIYWARDTRKGVSRDALVTGCSSIHKSLECAIHHAVELGENPRPWMHARDRLRQALCDRPDCFDRTWESKSRFAMDWFYPVLTGVVQGDQARQRLNARWRTFVEPGLGCRCVSDQPWVTIAETCELAMACVAAGARHRGRTLFENIRRHQAEDGSWWTGYVFADEALWPDERPTWTAGAVLLAADALTAATPASVLFTRSELPETLQHSERPRAFPRREQSRRQR